MAANDDRRIVAAIDFGTTYSGLCWGTVKQSAPGDHYAIMDWPQDEDTQRGCTSDKVPTRLHYDANDKVHWGYQIPDYTAGTRERFKLALQDKHYDGSGLFLESLPSCGEHLGPGPKSAVKLTEDYLTALIKHLKYDMNRRFGEEFIAETPIDYVVTVPAMWSEKEKERTLTACHNAGIGIESKVSLVAEPEAAAMYALHALKPHGLEVGDSIVLVDAGGGTVDLISYTIVSDYPVVSVKEACAGAGGLCGSTFLNQAFANLVIDTFDLKLDDIGSGGDIKEEWEGETESDKELFDAIMQTFDKEIKVRYSPKKANRGDFSVKVRGRPDNMAKGIKRGRWYLKALDLAAIFEPVMNHIKRLVSEQLTAMHGKAKAILVVGGFGQNVHLQESLRQEFDIQILSPGHAWTAVVRGAVMMGMSDVSKQHAAIHLSSRSARKHYGISLGVPYKTRIHSRQEKYWSDAEGMWRANHMKWFIKKGEEIQAGKPISIDFYFLQPKVMGVPTSQTICVWKDEASTIAPIHKGSSVKKLVTLEANFTDIHATEFKEVLETCKDGQEYYRMSGTIDATFTSASTQYTLNFRGKTYDRVHAELA